MIKLSKILILLTVCLAGLTSMANNVQVSNVTIVDATHISFDISWDNSWRVTAPPANHDAVWIFIKRALCPNPLVWLHAFVNPTGHTAGSPLEVYVDSYNPSDSTAGLFLRRSAPGYGDIENVSVTLELEPIVPAGEYEFKVFAIEMVYIPQGGFWVGDGSTTITSNSFNRFHVGNNVNGPYYIGSEAQIVVGVGPTQLYATGYVPPSSIPAEYPKGYNAIYCMKYEITQGQIADFFNYMPKQFSDTYFSVVTGIIPSSSETNGQVWLSNVWPTIVPKYPWRAPISLWGDNMSACNIFWLTYLDWIGLRPMTTFEFEKICRGLSERVPNEYAWGTALALLWNSGNTYQASYHDTLYYGTNAETHQAVLPAGTGIVSAMPGAIGIGRIYRVGFAAKTTTNRISAGATYYGVMDMSGSCYEGVIDVLNLAEMPFRAIPGNGCLSSNYEFNVPYWPRNTWGTSLTIFRGGYYHDSDIRKLTISSRYVNAGNQGSAYNYRGVR